MILTQKLQLLTNPDDFIDLKSTMTYFADICNFISKESFENKTFNKRIIHDALYYVVKEKFPLAGSQLIERAIYNVAASYKGKKNKETLHVFKNKSSVSYDSRMLSFKIDKLGFPFISIWTLGKGRKKIYLNLSKYQLNMFQQFKKQSELVLIDNKFYLNVPVQFEEKDQQFSENYIGVDLGVNNIAVTSNGKFYSSEKIEKRRKQLLELKSRLQSRGTKSAKRKLKKLSKKESRFKKDVNHQISKEIVELAQGTFQGIALENLTHIREKTTVIKKASRNERARRSSWAFFQLRQFIEYKGKMAGVEVKFINPKNTSRECCICGFTDEKNRKTTDEFECLQCGFKEHADLNAAIVISKRASVNSGIFRSTSKVLEPIVVRT